MSGLPPCVAITPDSPKTYSLIIEDEHLSIIPEMELDEFIKSSIENLVLTPSESDDASNCQVMMKIVSTEVNLIQNEVLESITSIPPGINSFYAESNLIESFLNRNTSIDSSYKIDSLLDEFAGELTLLKSIPPGIDDNNLDSEGEIHLVERLLYDNSSPPEELNVENSIESFSSFPIPVEDSDSHHRRIQCSYQMLRIYSIATGILRCMN
ncbi:hypothetical protein Tco_0123848 [Tanacetum coccineum]